jgi:hypothetical protein
MTALRAPLSAATAAVAGILAGAMLLIEIVLVPFWRGAPPREFRTWFAAHSGRIRGLMAPLGAASLGGAVATAVTESLTGGVPRPAAAAAAATAGVVAITVAVNEPANHELEREDLDDERTAALLRRWARWHDARVALGLVASAAALVTVASGRR